MTTPHGGGTRTAASAAPNTYASRRPSIAERFRRSVSYAAKLHAIPHDERTLGMCPACGVIAEPVRGRLPRGGAHRVSIAPSGQGWRCHSCTAGGNAADLVAYTRYRRPMAELSRDQLRELGQYVDQLLGEAPIIRPAPAYVPPSASEREARARDAEARRWTRVCTDAADYVRDLLARTGASSEREAWHAFERFEPPPTASETGAIVWRGQRITWGELRVAWLISTCELRERYFADDG